MLLGLEKMLSNPSVMKRLPRDLAFRYHALPVAEEDNTITVAMSNPENQEAVIAISNELKTRLYIVRSDQEVIDRLLNDIWQTNIDPHHRFVVWDCFSKGRGIVTERSDKRESDQYIHDFSKLFHAQVEYFETDGEKGALGNLFSEFGKSLPALLICTGLSPRARIFTKKIIRRLPASLLILQEPQWPIQKLLLIYTSSENDDAACDWVFQIARLTQAAVTILFVLTPLPIAYQQMGIPEPSVTEILSSNTPLGNWLRCLAQRFELWNIPGTICLRQGDPDWEIRKEIDDGDYDLIVLGAEPHNRIMQWFLRSLATPLISRPECPLLIAKRKNG